MGQLWVSVSLYLSLWVSMGQLWVSMGRCGAAMGGPIGAMGLPYRCYWDGPTGAVGQGQMWGSPIDAMGQSYWRYGAAL